MGRFKHQDGISISRSGHTGHQMIRLATLILHTMHLKKIVLFAAIGIGLVIVLLLPSRERLLTTRGIDNYEYHRPIFGDRFQSQTIAHRSTIFGIGLLLVNLGHTNPPADALVTITNDTDGSIVYAGVISGTTITDDTFTYLDLPQPIPAGNTPLRISVSSQGATAQNPLGIRFHPDDAYPAGQRFEKEKPATGDLAVAIVQRAPVWHLVQVAIVSNIQTSRVIGSALLLSLLVGALSLRLGWRNQPLKHRRVIELTLLTCIAIIALVSRLPLLNDFGGVTGGDPYNYLSITQSISHGENPLAGVKRLPGYPLLLLPAYLTSLDDILWMRSISIVSAAGIVLLIGLLARRLRLPWAVQLITSVILACQKDFWWISFRPEPYTFYALLLLTSLWLFFNLSRRWQQIGFGLIIGYAAMTRQEGFVLAALFGVAAVAHLVVAAIRQRLLLPSLLKQYIVAFGTSLVLVLPFFISNTIQYGNPLYTSYFEGERLAIVDSWPAFVDAVGATWGVLDSLWHPNWDQLQRLDLSDPLLALGAATTLLWWSYWWVRRRHEVTWWESVGVSALAVILLSGAGYNAAIGVGHFGSLINPLFAGALLVSSIPFVIMTGWRGVLVVAVAISQILIAAWFHPFPKHYQQDYALLVLILITTLGASSPHPERKSSDSWDRALARALIVFPLLAMIIILFQPNRQVPLIDEYNEDAALDSVVYRAVQNARQLPGPYGLDQHYQQTSLYLGGALKAYASDQPPTSDELAAWLTTNGINTLLITNNQPGFPKPPATWHEVAHHKAAAHDEQIWESFVYRNTAPIN